jgi:putative transposase
MATIRARIRRAYAPGEVYFITTVTEGRQPLFADTASRDLLRETLRRVREMDPFEMHAYVFLPDHVHLLIRVPGTTDVSRIMHSLKRNFTRNWKRASGVTTPVKLWQRGFWDHVIRDDRDYEVHLDYIHFNPVKHSYVGKPEDYRDTSFHEYVRRGWYDIGWGHTEPAAIRGIERE